MKKIIAVIALLLLITNNVISQTEDEQCVNYIAQNTLQSYDKQCYYGISFEISKNKNWGYGELVITDVEPNSAAEAAGLKVNDIIMEINGKATFLRTNVMIAEWLFDNPDPVVTFTIRNVDTYFKEYTLERECITVNSVDESYLATIFSFYSLEDTRQQTFTLPLQVTPTPDVDFTDYHTYSFYDEGQESNSALDTRVKVLLEQNLQKSGLKKDIENPDIWINLYYEYGANPKFTGLQESDGKGNAIRFDTQTKKMTNLPIYEMKDATQNVQGQYIAKLGFTFYDKKNIDSTKYTQIWECEIQDFLSANYSLEEYARLHIPLMLMQYPYAEAKTESKYYVNFLKYNYTGMHFDADMMNVVNDVNPKSPAFTAGIRPGYKINKLNGKSFSFTKDEITNGYRKFVEDTETYRNTNSKFTGSDGYKDYMFWNVGYYSDIAKQFKKDEYRTAFSYLYDFAKYVNPKQNDAIAIEAWDGMQKRIFTVQPKIRESVVIKTY